MKRRCIACGTLSDETAAVCSNAECASLLTYAEEVFDVPSVAETPAAPAVQSTESVRGASAGGMEFCACNPSPFEGEAGTSICGACNLPLQPRSGDAPRAEDAPVSSPTMQTSSRPAILAYFPGGTCLEVRDGLIIGRDCHGSIPALQTAMAAAPGVSRVHAWIGTDGEDVLILDLGSRNGTRVGDKPLTRGVMHRTSTGSFPLRMCLGTGFEITLQSEASR